MNDVANNALSKPNKNVQLYYELQSNEDNGITLVISQMRSIDKNNSSKIQIFVLKPLLL